MLKRMLILLIVPLVFLGCHKNVLNIKIRYDEIQGLKEGARVIFGKNHVGQVTGVFYSTDGYYVADLAIKSDFANAATESSMFFIIGDPRNEAEKAVEIIQARPGGPPLQDGAVVEGSTKPVAIFNQASDEFDKRLKALKDQFERFLEDLRSVPESEEFKKLEKELQRLAEEMKRSGKSMREEIQKEVLPRLRQEIEKLRERLRKFGREEEIGPFETQMKEIFEI